jgi:hypothetical protein
MVAGGVGGAAEGIVVTAADNLIDGEPLFEGVSWGSVFRDGALAALTAGIADNIARRADEVPDALTEADRLADELRGQPGRPTAVAAAVDTRTGSVYYGRSGEMTVRPAELEELLPNPSRMPWPAANCAEVAACASAIGNGANLSDLSVAAVRVSTGEYFPACRNCSTWVPGGPR